jgi:5-methylcytosine-specific restriction protein B
LPALLDQQGTVVDLTDAVDILNDLLDATHEHEPDPPDDPHPPRAALPRVTPTLASALHMDVPSLQEIVELLEARKQVVL